MADWKENKIVGIVAGAVAVVTLLFVILSLKDRFGGEKSKSEYPSKEGVPAIEIKR